MGQNEASKLRDEILKIFREKHLEKCLLQHFFVCSEPSSYFTIKNCFNFILVNFSSKTVTKELQPAAIL